MTTGRVGEYIKTLREINPDGHPVIYTPIGPAELWSGDEGKTYVDFKNNPQQTAVYDKDGKLLGGTAKDMIIDDSWVKGGEIGHEGETTSNKPKGWGGPHNK